jgi:hypothetical protein
MNVEYCEKWWIGRNKPIHLIDDESARRRHECRQPYAAIIGGSEQPRYVVDVAGDSVAVIFIDRHLRQYLRYNFQEKQPGRLFLRSAYYWEYEGEGGSPVSTKLFSFCEDGQIVMEDHSVVTDEVRELEATASVDANWDNYPQFGDYTAICKENRTSH